MIEPARENAENRDLANRPAHRTFDVNATIMVANVTREADALVVGAAEAQRIESLLGEMGGQCADSAVSADECVELSTAVVGALPSHLLRAVHRFRNRGNSNDVLLIRGLLRDFTDLGPTPASATAQRSAAAQRRALCLLGIMGLFGEAFTFRDLHDARIVQDVVAAPGAESAQTSEGSDAFLEWHVEDAFSDDRCDYFGLLCLRGDPTASTLVCSTRRLDIAARWRQVLREPRFAVVPDVAHTGVAGTRVAVSVLSDDEPAPEIRFDPVYMEPFHPNDIEAREAMTCLGQAVVRAAVGHTLVPGDLLIVDNRRVAHARTAFRPRYDGTDRWLMRAMVCSSLPQYRARRAARVVN